MSASGVAPTVITTDSKKSTAEGKSTSSLKSKSNPEEFKDKYKDKYKESKESKDSNEFFIDRESDAVKIQKQLRVLLANEELSEEKMADEKFRNQFSKECIRLACELWFYDVSPFTILTKFSKDYLEKEEESEKKKAREEAKAVAAAAKNAEVATKEDDNDPWGVAKKRKAKAASDSDADDSDDDFGDEQEDFFAGQEDPAEPTVEAASHEAKVSKGNTLADADDGVDPWGAVAAVPPSVKKEKPDDDDLWGDEPMAPAEPKKEAPKKKISQVINEIIEQLKIVLKEQRQARSKKIKDDFEALKIKLGEQGVFNNQEAIKDLKASLKEVRAFLEKYKTLHEYNLKYKENDPFKVDETPLDLELAELREHCLPVVVQIFKVTYFVPSQFKVFNEHVARIFGNSAKDVYKIGTDGGMFNMPALEPSAEDIASANAAALGCTVDQLAIASAVAPLPAPAPAPAIPAKIIISSLERIEEQLQQMPAPILTPELTDQLIATFNPDRHGFDIFLRILQHLAGESRNLWNFIEIFFALEVFRQAQIDELKPSPSLGEDERTRRLALAKKPYLLGEYVNLVGEEKNISQEKDRDLLEEYRNRIRKKYSYINQVLVPIFKMALYYFIFMQATPDPRAVKAIDYLYFSINANLNDGSAYHSRFHEECMYLRSLALHHYQHGSMVLFEAENREKLTKPSQKEEGSVSEEEGTVPEGEETVPEERGTIPVPESYLKEIIASNHSPNDQIRVLKKKQFDSKDFVNLAGRELDSTIQKIVSREVIVSVPFHFPVESFSPDDVQVLLLANAFKFSFVADEDPIASVFMQLCRFPVSKEAKDAKAQVRVYPQDKWSTLECTLSPEIPEPTAAQREEAVQQAVTAHHHFNKMEAQFPGLRFFPSGDGKMTVRVVGLEKIFNYMTLIAVTYLIKNGQLENLSRDVTGIVLAFLAVPGLPPPQREPCLIQHRF